MAQPADTFDSYDQVGIREDLSDMIDMISPEETPFFTKTAKSKATNTLTEWQTDSLRASGVNAHIEGDNTSASARTPTSRLGNYTQIFKDAATISDTDDGLDKAGRGKEMSYQVLKMTAALKLDIEKALFANQARVAGSSTVARRMAGIPAWLVTNTVFESGSSGADPTGDGTDARTDDGVPVAFSQARFNTAMQDTWTSGGKPDTVYLSTFQMDVALGFVGNNNERANTESTKAQVTNDIVLYRTPWGRVGFQMSRECRSRDVFLIQSDKWKIRTLRGMKNTSLGKTGDNTTRQIVTELTLEASNEAANGAIYDNTTS